MTEPDAERLRRWRLVLGGEDDGTQQELTGADLVRDRALQAVYGGEGERGAGLGGSAPRVARWLGDVRAQFPTSVVRVLQQDAVDRLGLDRLLLEPELLEAVEPDVHLVGTLLALQDVLPARSRETARRLVRAVVDDLRRRLAQPTRTAVTGALNRAARTRRPRRPSEVDWDRTIRQNLRHFQPDLGTVIPATLIGHGRRGQAVKKDLVLAVDQSGSMASSVVYAGVFGAVLASLPSVSTRLVAFDTSVVDLTEDLHDPVDVLFGIQLGGGTDINRAIAYCQGSITSPRDTVLVLISDLFEGGDRDDLLRRCAQLVRSGVKVVALLALSDDGAPAYDHDNAAALAALGVPAFACTPDGFPDLMAAAIEGRDLTAFAEERELGAR